MNDRFSPKDPLETIVLSVDMTGLLDADTIQTSEWIISREDNLSENTSGMLSGVASVTGNIVSQEVTGGTAGGSYIHRVKVVLTPSGRSLVYGVRQSVLLGA